MTSNDLVPSHLAAAGWVRRTHMARRLHPRGELHDFIEDALDVVFLIDADDDDVGRPTRIVISSEDDESPLDIDIAQITFLYDYG